MIFIFLYAARLKVATEGLEASGLLVTAPSSDGKMFGPVPGDGPPEDISSVLFADDGAFASKAPPAQIANNMGSIASIIISALVSAAVQVNMSPGKTEVLIFFAGDGIRPAREALEDAGSTVPFTALGRSTVLIIVPV